ncbi:MAG: carboxypeptidase-like regulatory domain-containing protein [Acidobacteria bacterium]|nr:carboxypeptidase-like regulatory domain-containing protein [Acidobacteriota bacterium]MCI0720046.1 carboxypeptidase-like regulatory domain-containing protein [Acidobacteriota bacterium]
MKFLKRNHPLASLPLLSLMVGVVLAQTPTGTILGTLTDQSGAVVPDATVIVTNLGTNRTLSVRTNESGNYVAPLLNPGEYSVTRS